MNCDSTLVPVFLFKDYTFVPRSTCWKFFDAQFTFHTRASWEVAEKLAGQSIVPSEISWCDCFFYNVRPDDAGSVPDRNRFVFDILFRSRSLKKCRNHKTLIS
jgi:hypothetical protein